MARPTTQPVARGGDAAIREMGRFFLGNADVQQALRRITSRLEELAIPYAVVGGMALVAHGYMRTTDDVNLLVTPAGLAAIHAALDGLGYVPPFAGSKQLRDVEANTRIEFLVTGQFPGDGKPKPVAFPDPGTAGVDIDGIRYLALPALVDLKLASGMTTVGRLRDLADVQELIRLLPLSEQFADRLHPYVRETFYQLHRAVSSNPS